MEVVPVAEGLPRMQALASRLWSPAARQHPGQLAWSVAYALPEELDHGPVAIASSAGDDVAWVWQEGPDWIELCLDPAHPAAGEDLLGWAVAGDGALATMVLETERHLLDLLTGSGFVVDEAAPWFTHHHLDLVDLRTSQAPSGYLLRPVTGAEAEARAACHRDSWSATSKVSGPAYARLMETAPYRHALDWVAVDADGRMVASALVWLDDSTGVALVEPVGCVPEHRGHGLAGVTSLAALAAAAAVGATTGLVCPRGDDDYPAPGRVYRGLGFEPGPRTLTLRREARPTLA